VLAGITPNISAWSYGGDALREYLNSLDKLAWHETEWAFPGHRAPFKDVGARVSHIRRHHEARSDEILLILASGPETALEVASHMTWGIRGARWDAVPALQRLLAGGEALAHLEYLLGQGRVESEVSVCIPRQTDRRFHVMPIT